MKLSSPVIFCSSPCCNHRVEAINEDYATKKAEKAKWHKFLGIFWLCPKCQEKRSD